MDPVVLALISLRSLALAASIAGRTQAANSLYALADSVEAGRATDAHMREVAEKLKNRELTEEDWADVAARIDADAARLHGGD